MADYKPVVQSPQDLKAALYYSIAGDNPGVGFSRASFGQNLTPPTPPDVGIQRVFGSGDPWQLLLNAPPEIQRYMNQAMFGKDTMSPLMKLIMGARMVYGGGL